MLLPELHAPVLSAMLRHLSALLLLLPWPAIAADGAALYAQRCAVCHQTQGQGIAGHAPPLTGMEQWLATEEGRTYIARVVIHGLAGPITVRGQPYSDLMLTFRWRLQDDDLVAVLRYVAETLNEPAAGYKPISLETLSAARAASGRDVDSLALRARLPER
ncbi:cytochrome c [Solimonas sp. K1W22B-7]|nr:cytochrome c [Solimonas sp. K1W22B-7]